MYLFVPDRKHSISMINTDWLFIVTLCGQNAEFLILKQTAEFSDHWTLKGSKGNC
jgi:hypothetical protein